MKTQFFNVLFSFAVLSTSFSLFAQPKNVQNAAMDYNSYEKALTNGNNSGAKRAILAAKISIDDAFSNPTTAQDLKMFFYRGKIYMGLALMAMMMSNDEELTPYSEPAIAQTGLDAWKSCYDMDTKGKYRDDIKMQIMLIAMQGNTMGGKMFSEKKYEEAFSLYSGSVKMYDVISKMDQDYGAAAFNAGLCADRISKFDEAFKYFSLAEKAGFEPAGSAAKASNALYAQGKTNEAMDFVIEASKKYPGDGTLIVTMADLALKTGKDDLAIASLNMAIEKDPKNGVYHWAVGTVYQRLGKEEDAIKSYLTATQLSPKDERAFLNLGILHFNKAADLMTQANSLKLNDPQFASLEKQAMAEFEKSAPYFEQSLQITGDAGNKEILNNLFTIYRKLGKSEKSLEFKKRADAVK